MRGRALFLLGPLAFASGCYAEARPAPVHHASAPLAAKIIAPDPSTPPSVRERFFRDRIVIRSLGDSWVFADTSGRPIAENEFIRRFRTLTGSHELDEMERRRNGPALVLSASIFVAGAALAGALGGFCAQTDPSSGAPRDCDAWVFAIVIGSGAALISGAAFVTSLASPDGSSRHHFLTREHAEAYAERYNEELLAVAPGPREPVPAQPQGLLVRPALAPGFIGVKGNF